MTTMAIRTTRRFARLLAGPALALAAAGTARAQAPGTLLYYWTQAGAGGEWLLRTVYDGGTACPAPATVRALPSGDFPVLVCQQTLSGAPVRLPGVARAFSAPGQVSRVVVIGDTGCRAQEQDCNDPDSWPFARVAGLAAGAGGQLTVHVGDYIYRERCASNVPQPCGDKWRTWVADWFQPVGELLSAAPWVFARGNHEDCSRGGRGWFLFFDPRPVPADGCDDTTDPYAVTVAGVGKLLILDSACAPWYSSCWPYTPPGASRPVNDSAQAVAAYAPQLAQVARLAQGSEPAWLVTHVPVWARDLPGQRDSVGAYILQAALAQASGGALPVALSLFGHIHTWQAMDFAAPRTPILVLGDGGTSESEGIQAPPTGSPLAGGTVEGFWNNLAFGYTVMEATGSGWRVTLHPITGAAGNACTIANGQLAC